MIISALDIEDIYAYVTYRHLQITSPEYKQLWNI